MKRSAILLAWVSACLPACLLAGLLASPIVATRAFAAESTPLREIMGDDVYGRSGIQSLSQPQIEVLERWVLNNAAQRQNAERPPALPDPPPREPDAGAPIAADEAEDPAAQATQEPVAADAPADTAEEREREDDVIRSRIDGPFEGWRNNGTRFRLENGQIWEQRQSGTFITDLDSPEVIIRRNRFGHTMEVPQIDRKVHVRRIR